MKIPELSWPAVAGGYDDELLLEMEAGIVAYLVRGRNAWHSTWVRHVFLNTRLFSDVGSAKSGAEPLRQRGNVFYIQETPALLLRGSSRSVILCDHHVQIPFDRFAGLEPIVHETPEGRWIEGIYPGVSLRDAVASFTETSNFWGGPRKDPDTLLRGVVEADYQFAARSGNLRSLTSYPQGADARLGWAPDARGRGFRESGAQSIADNWKTAAERATGTVFGDGRARADAFVEYRESYLGVTPSTVWQARREASQLALKARRDELLSAWTAARGREQELRMKLAFAGKELRAASVDRLKLSDTSAGMRAQRERLDAAERELASLTVAVSQARQLTAQALLAVVPLKGKSP